ncbi:hypothetical protein ES703_101972 [subsurface metagenome]
MPTALYGENIEVKGLDNSRLMSYLCPRVRKGRFIDFTLAILSARIQNH